MKDMESSANWRRLCSFAFLLKQFSESTEDDGNSEKYANKLHFCFACFYLSIFFERTFEADLSLSYLSQMSKIVIFVPNMNEILFGKRLTNGCGVSFDNVPDDISGIVNG